MFDYLRAQRGKVALLLGGLVLAYAATAWARDGALAYDPWAVD